MTMHGYTYNIYYPGLLLDLPACHILFTKYHASLLLLILTYLVCFKELHFYFHFSLELYGRDRNSQVNTN